MPKSCVHVRWNDEHLNLLAEKYPLGIKAAMEALPMHTEGAIRTRASNLGIKLNAEAMKIAHNVPKLPREPIILAAIRNNPGSKISVISAITGFSVPSLHSRMTSMKNRGLIYPDGLSTRTVWYAEEPSPEFDTKQEYVKVSSIFRVGDRCAALMRAA